jgi:prolyl-tRNA editing enzyme YbaK/EbsC (Cys-tRNA(Pro) deacylase)
MFAPMSGKILLRANFSIRTGQNECQILAEDRPAGWKRWNLQAKWLGGRAASRKAGTGGMIGRQPGGALGNSSYGGRPLRALRALLANTPVRREGCSAHKNSFLIDPASHKMEPRMSDQVLTKIRDLLTERGVEFREISHVPTTTSAESARVRGESLSVGAKALLVKTDDVFRLFVLPADRQFDSKRVKQELKAKSIRFATADELLEQTGLVPGSVPPFGTPILPFELYGDRAIGTIEDKVAFNAGSLTNSIVMKATDWRAIAAPGEFSFAKPPEGP